jgi:hypothetical protein
MPAPPLLFRDGRRLLTSGATVELRPEGVYLRWTDRGGALYDASTVAFPIAGASEQQTRRNDMTTHGTATDIDGDLAEDINGRPMLIIWPEVDGRMSREYLASPDTLETWFNAQQFNIPEELRQRLRDIAHPRPERRIITPAGAALEELRDVSIQALVEQNSPPVFYRQGGQVTEVFRNEKHHTTLKPVSNVRMKERLAEVAEWLNADQSTHIHPPAAAGSVLLETQELHLPPVEMVTEIPVLRSDGKFTLNQGYDRLARVFFAPSTKLGFFKVPDTATSEDVREAFEWFAKLLGDFPFVENADKTNVLAFMLTPIIRPIVEGPTPMAAVSAPRPGTGKTLLVDSIVRMLIGRPPSTLKLGDDEDEAEKRITAHLLKGPQFSFLDNIKTGTKLDSAALATVLTAATWSGRVIGTSKMPDLPNSATWVATGNNLQLGGEIAQRSYLIELDAKMERPRDRDVNSFAVPNLLSWVAEHRVELLTRALILVRAWTQAGAPETSSPTLGSFEDWSHKIGGIMAILGEMGGYSFDFLGNEGRKRAEFETEDVDETAMFLELAHAVMADSVWSSGELLRATGDTANLLHAALPNDIDAGSKGAAKKLGYALRHVAKGTYGDYSLRKTGSNTRRGGALWQVTKRTA